MKWERIDQINFELIPNKILYLIYGESFGIGAGILHHCDDGFKWFDNLNFSYSGSTVRELKDVTHIMFLQEPTDDISFSKNSQVLKYLPYLKGK